MSGSVVRILSFLIALACALAATPGRADPKRQTSMEVDFEALRGEEPSHLCVISGMILSSSRKGRAELIKNMAEAKKMVLRAAVKASDGKWQLPDDLRQIILSTSADLDEPPPAAPSSVASPDPPADPAEGCRTGNKQCASTISFRPGDTRPPASAAPAASAAPVASVAPAASGAPAADAAPVTIGKGPLEIVCVKNKEPSLTSDASRIVFVRLEFTAPQQGNAAIEELSLSRDKVRLTLQGTKEAPLVPAVIVIGGDYRDDTGVTRGSRIVAPLVPRCRDVPVQLPASSDDAGSAWITLDVPGVRDRQFCRAEINREGSFLLAVPTSPGNGKRIVTVTPDGPGRGHMYNAYRASWFTESLPVVVALRHSKVSFRWKADCHYPLEQDGTLRCPSPRVDAPVKCTESSYMECVYVCSPIDSSQYEGLPGAPQDRTPEFDLPLGVHFTGASGETWDEKLTHANQTLDGYVAPADRILRVDFPKWGEPATSEKGVPSFAEAQRWEGVVKAVTLSVGGAAYRVSVRPRAVVRVPNVGCEESISYELEADRPHHASVIEVSGGRLEIPPPSESERILNLGLGASGTFQFGGDHSVNVRPAGGVQLIAAARPRGWAWAFEARLSASLSTQLYYQLPDPNVASGRGNRVAYNRYQLDVSAWGIPFHTGRLGIGGGLAFGHTTLGEDEIRAGGFQARPFFFVGGRVFLQRNVSLDVQVGTVIDEALFRLSPNDYRGSPQLEPVGVTSAVLGIQLNFWPLGMI